MKKKVLRKNRLAYFFILCAFGCKKKDAENMHWQESQVLCVYWSPYYHSRDTLPAINVILENQGEWIKNGDFKFVVAINNEKQIIPLKLNAVVRKEAKDILGLVLESKELYPYFKEYRDVEGGDSCYEKALERLVENGEVYFVDKRGEEQKIDKSSGFNLTIGLK